MHLMKINHIWNNHSELNSVWEDLEAAYFCFSNFPPFLIEEIPSSQEQALGTPSISIVKQYQKCQTAELQLNLKTMP